jgi:hypothetical protein
MVVRINLVNNTVEQMTPSTQFANPVALLWVQNSQSIYIADADRHV